MLGGWILNLVDMLFFWSDGKGFGVWCVIVLVNEVEYDGYEY